MIHFKLITMNINSILFKGFNKKYFVFVIKNQFKNNEATECRSMDYFIFHCLLIFIFDLIAEI